MNAPIQTILRAGGKVVGEMDDGRLHRKEGGVFAHIKYAVTRKDSPGRTWGPQQAVDKQTALKMFTRWAAEYVLRENTLGSLEPGKWADFAVIDRDYLNMPDEDLSKVNVLMTAVAGKAVYTDADFARAKDCKPWDLNCEPGDSEEPANGVAPWISFRGCGHIGASVLADLAGSDVGGP